MVTVDFRSRFEGDVVLLDVADFLEDLAPAMRGPKSVAAAHAARRLGLEPLTLDVEGEQLTFGPESDGLHVRGGGAGDAIVVALDRQAFSDLVQDVASTFGLQMTGRARISRGASDGFVGWEPILRCLLDGRPVPEPGPATFATRDGSPLDLGRSFTLEDDPEEIGHFLAEAGYLHIQGVFTEAEMAAVSGDLDDAMAVAERDDGASWWARTATDEWYPSRILGFNQRSPALRALLHSERFTRIGTFTDDSFEQRDPDHGDSAEGLLKKVGVVEGISDVSWHKDCAMGGHSRRCCGLTVGISVTGAQRNNGELGVVAGSHRANVAPLGIVGVDLPRVPLPTNTGDVTVHCSCALHMSRPPVSAERRVVYTGFGLAPRPGDRRRDRSEEEVRAERAALNGQVLDQQRHNPLDSRSASYEL